MRERLEEKEDVGELQRMPSKPLKFRGLDEFLKEQGLIEYQQ